MAKKTKKNIKKYVIEHETLQELKEMIDQTLAMLCDISQATLEDSVEQLALAQVELEALQSEFDELYAAVEDGELNTDVNVQDDEDCCEDEDDSFDPALREWSFVEAKTQDNSAHISVDAKQRVITITY